MRPSPDPAAARTVLVVFEDRAAPGVMRWLRPGFRHCFCALGSGGRWTVCDPLKSRTVLDSVDGMSRDSLVQAWLSLGARVLAGPLPDTAARRRLAPLTCVELVKSVLGVDLPLVITPFQLWRTLTAEKFGFYAIDQVDDPIN